MAENLESRQPKTSSSSDENLKTWLDRQIRKVAWIGVAFVAFAFIFGVYLLPLLQDVLEPVNADRTTAAAPANTQGAPSQNAGQDDDGAGQRLDYATYLLTFLGTVLTVGGLGFALFGYYQTHQLPDMVEKEVKKQLKEEVGQHLRDLSDDVNRRLQALEYLLENAIIAPHSGKVEAVSHLAAVEEAEKLYKDLWGLKYYRAIFTYYDTKDRNKAINLLGEHLEANPHHLRAYNYLILWCLSQKYPGKAVTALEQLLEADPDSCREENLLSQREWYRSPDLVKERNRYLFRAERKLYEQKGELDLFRDPGHKTPLEELLERLHHRDDLPEDVKKPELYLRHHVLKGEL